MRMPWQRTPQEILIQTLLDRCRNALGAYKALEMFGIDSYLPSYESCLQDLKRDIDIAESYLETGELPK